MKDKFLFFNITWMRGYSGLRNDSVSRGGDYIKKRGWGHEIFNFSPIKGSLYGYGAVEGEININRLGAIWILKKMKSGGSAIPALSEVIL